MTSHLARLPDLPLLAVLSANFDPASLQNRLRDAGVEFDPGIFVEGEQVYGFALSAIRQRPGVSRWIQNYLDRMHRNTVLEVELSSWEQLSAWFECVRTGNGDPMQDQGGRLWALVRDSRPIVAEALQSLFIQWMRGGVRSMTYRRCACRTSKPAATNEAPQSTRARQDPQDPS